MRSCKAGKCRLVAGRFVWRQVWRCACRRPAARSRKQVKLVVGTEMQFCPLDSSKNGQQAGLNKGLFAESVGQRDGRESALLDLPLAERCCTGSRSGQGRKHGSAVPLTGHQGAQERYTYTAAVRRCNRALLHMAARTEYGAQSSRGDFFFIYSAGKTVGGGQGLGRSSDQLKGPMVANAAKQPEKSRVRRQQNFRPMRISPRAALPPSRKLL